MNDIVTVQTTANFFAMNIPSAVAIQIPDDDPVWVKLDAVTPNVIDALAWQWLEHLYAGLNRDNPYKRPLPAQASQ